MQNNLGPETIVQWCKVLIGRFFGTQSPASADPAPEPDDSALDVPVATPPQGSAPVAADAIDPPATEEIAAKAAAERINAIEPLLEKFRRDLLENWQILSDDKERALVVVDSKVQELKRRLIAGQSPEDLWRIPEIFTKEIVADVVVKKILPNIREAQEAVLKVVNRHDPREDGGGIRVDRSWTRCMNELVEVLNAFERGQSLFNNRYDWAIGNFLTKLQNRDILNQEDLPATIDSSLLPFTFTEARQILRESRCLAAPIKRYYMARDLFTYDPKIGASSSTLGHQVNLLANMYSELITNYKKVVSSMIESEQVVELNASLLSCGLNAAFLDWKDKFFYNRNVEWFVGDFIAFMGLPTRLAFDGTEKPMADNQFFKALLLADSGGGFDSGYRGDILLARCTASEEYLQDASRFMDLVKDHCLNFGRQLVIIKEAASLINYRASGLQWIKIYFSY